MWDEEAGIWSLTSENPFEIQDCEMEDDFTVKSAESSLSNGVPFMIQSVDEIFYSSDEDTVEAPAFYETPYSSDEDTIEAPWAPIKKQRTKRYIKTPLEQDICRALFV
jgi:hypothetical protein